MIVLDASAAVELVLRTPAGLRLERLVEDPETRFHAPHLIDAEVGQVLRRLAGRGDVSAGRAWNALVDFAALDLLRYPHELLLPRAWELRHNATIYDGFYVALAELLEATLVTTDLRLARLPGIEASVTVLP